MDYREHVQRAVEYIEINLKNEINSCDCACEAGYSIYHFQRIFNETVGLTAAEYIRKRRLSEIAKRICESDGYIADIAFEYGFNSKENFIRAFKSEHHVLPSEYKVTKNSLKLYEKVRFDIEPVPIIPAITHLDGFKLTVFQNDEKLITNFWNKYNCGNYSRMLSGGEICEDYGVGIWERSLEYFIGIRSELVRGESANTLELQIPDGLYAVFMTPKATHYTFISTIHRTREYINTVWLPQSGYKRRGCYEFESYIEESRVFSEKICIPIVQDSYTETRKH